MTLAKKDVEKAVKAYNEQAEAKAQLVKLAADAVTVTISGKEFEYENEASFYDLKAELEEATGAQLAIGKIAKLAATYTVTFVLDKGKTPADEIIDVLKKYDEGTPPRPFDLEED
ncbi:MAG: hypothetical protein HYY37_04675 [Candidatus Aenigmarchaeota archaeon]|nr:hypothetical protein [Candidatus Aenigmarchaeota archaeon]